MDALFCLKSNFIVIYHKIKCFLMFFLRDFSKFMIESFIWKGKQILIDFFGFLTEGPHLFSIITNIK